jgi:D-alanyl-D-alanine carboxypeptidase (penicillin-binding protein 5/6)
VMHPQASQGAVYAETRALLYWGFEAVGQVRPVGSLPSLPSAAAQRVHAAAPEPAARAKPLFSVGTLVAAGAAALLMAGWGFLALRRTPGGRPAS